MTSIIDLTYTISDIGALNKCVIDQEVALPSNHKVILCDLTRPKGETGSMGDSREVTGRGFRALSEDSRKEAVKA